MDEANERAVNRARNNAIREELRVPPLPARRSCSGTCCTSGNFAC